MRILCIAEEFPWPPHSGYRIRLANVIRGLSQLGELDCFFVLNDGVERPPCIVPEAAGIARYQIVEEGPPTSTAVRLRRWATSRLPLGLLWRRWTFAPGALRAFARRYDLVWFSHIDCYVALGDAVDGPAIVDLDTLEDFRLRYSLEHRKAADDEWHRSAGESRGIGRKVRDEVAKFDVGRWDRLQHRVARAVDGVVLCSELDRTRLGEPNCFVVPNGYDLPESGAPLPSGSPDTAPSEPIMTMVGALSYEPNYDGAWWFARRVLPHVRAERPDAVFRLVGRVADEVAALHDEPGVVLRGRVDDIGAELGEARLEVVPLRSGGGTRVKILEAFAHRVPVVTTSVGCEGLDVVDGEHVLIADEPEAFAAACLRLLRDDDLRARLVDAAFDVYSQRFRWSELRSSVAEAATAVVGRAS